VVIVPPRRAEREAAGMLFRFAERGGVVACFRQDRSDDYAVVPVPDGQSLTMRGAREAKARYTDSARMEAFHPILSSLRAPVSTVLIDGYVEHAPAGASVLLRSVRDGAAPALIVYRVGKGSVVVGSLFGFDVEEYGADSQAMTGGLEIVRDLITWARDPEGPIPVVSAGETVRLGVEVFNRSARPSSVARLRAWTPSRERVTEERDVVVALRPGARTSVPFALTVGAEWPLGIHHLDFELRDAAGAVQPEVESASGRFAVATPAVRALAAAPAPISASPAR
jgi:hypothetical protein